MIKKIIKGRTKNNSDDKILKPYFTINPTDSIPIKDIYVCKVVSNYPDITKVQTIMENALFVKKTNNIYTHIASGRDFSIFSIVEQKPTMFAVDNIKFFTNVFNSYIEEHKLGSTSTISVEEISNIENTNNNTASLWFKSIWQTLKI